MYSLHVCLYNIQTFYYDGNVPCFSGEHLGFAIPALLLLVFVVLLGPAVVILISFKRYKVSFSFSDQIYSKKCLHAHGRLILCIVAADHSGIHRRDHGWCEAEDEVVGRL